MSMSIWGPTLQTTAPLTLCRQRDQGTRGGTGCEVGPLRARREAFKASWSGFEQSACKCELKLRLSTGATDIECLYTATDLGVKEKCGVCGRVGSAINAGCQKENAGVYTMLLSESLSPPLSSSQDIFPRRTKHQKAESQGCIE
ncbi:hypothetical protein PAMP_019699 [Pampus punctatissimus]